MTKAEKLVNSVMKGKNVKAHKCLESMLKAKCAAKIAKILKNVK